MKPTSLGFRNRRPLFFMDRGSSPALSHLQAPSENLVNFDCQLSENFGYVYTPEQVKEVQNRWQVLTGSKFVSIKTTKEYGKNDFDDLLKHNLKWELPGSPAGTARKSNKGLDYDGIPFVIIATKIFDCQYGVDRHRKRKLETDNIRNQKSSLEVKKRLRSNNKDCKKLNCPAQLVVKDVLKFPHFALNIKQDTKRTTVTRKLRQSLEENKNVVGERRYYVKLPLDVEHNDHPLMESSAMKAVQQAHTGGAETLFIDPVQPIPKPGDKEIVIEIFNSAVNRVDIIQRKGAAQAPKGASPIIGVEASGKVHKLGEKCSRKWKEGDRVMALLSGGGYAEYATVHEDHLMAIPDHLTFAEAAAIPEVWLTAYQLLHLIAKVSEGEYVLIHAGGSGVGTAAIQLTVLAGAHAIVTAGTQEKVDKALSLGAIAAINYKTESFTKKVSEVTEEKGVDIILDCIGSDYLSRNLDALALDSRWVLYGLLSGPLVKGKFLAGLLRKRATLLATLLRSRSDEYKADLVKQFTTNALPLFSAGSSSKLKVIIDTVFPLHKVQEAHKHVEQNKNIGKVVLQVKVDKSERETTEEVEEDEIVVLADPVAHEEL